MPGMSRRRGTRNDYTWPGYVDALSSLLNAGIADSGHRRRSAAHDPLTLLREFRAANRRLWQDGEGGLSLAATTLFWGVGATLQFAVLRWAGAALALPLSQAAYLQAAVAVGVPPHSATSGWRGRSSIGDSSPVRTRSGKCHGSHVKVRSRTISSTRK